MLAGIGITIVLQQAQVLLGGKPAGSAAENLVRLPAALAGVELHSAVLGLVVIGLLVMWKYLLPAVRRVPGPLAAVAIGTAISVSMAPGIERIALDGSIFDAVALPGLPDGNWSAAPLAVFRLP